MFQIEIPPTKGYNVPIVLEQSLVDKQLVSSRDQYTDIIRRWHYEQAIDLPLRGQRSKVIARLVLLYMLYMHIASYYF